MSCCPAGRIDRSKKISDRQAFEPPIDTKSGFHNPPTSPHPQPLSRGRGVPEAPLGEKDVLASGFGMSCSLGALNPDSPPIYQSNELC
jgi:hypothetical protein